MLATLHGRRLKIPLVAVVTCTAASTMQMPSASAREVPSIQGQIALGKSSFLLWKIYESLSKLEKGIAYANAVANAREGDSPPTREPGMWFGKYLLEALDEGVADLERIQIPTIKPAILPSGIDAVMNGSPDARRAFLAEAVVLWKQPTVIYTQIDSSIKTLQEIRVRANTAHAAATKMADALSTASQKTPQIYVDALGFAALDFQESYLPKIAVIRATTDWKIQRLQALRKQAATEYDNGIRNILMLLTKEAELLGKQVSVAQAKLTDMTKQSTDTLKEIAEVRSLERNLLDEKNSIRARESELQQKKLRTQQEYDNFDHPGLRTPVPPSLTKRDMDAADQRSEELSQIATNAYFALDDFVKAKKSRLIEIDSSLGHYAQRLKQLWDKSKTISESYKLAKAEFDKGNEFHGANFKDRAVILSLRPPYAN